MRPLILALETSTPWLSCALLERGGDALVVRATRAAGPAAQTSTLVPGVFEEVLREAGASLDDVGVLVAGLGPGLFTGTRVAVGTLKAVAYARSIPLIGGGSLDAMALAAARGASLASGDRVTFESDLASGLLCPVLDARKGELYASLVRVRGGVVHEEVPAFAGTPAALASKLAALAEPVAIFGTGLAAAQGLLSATHLHHRASPLTPGAAETAWAALTRERTPTFDLARILALEPAYLRPPEAEVARQRRAVEPPKAS